MSEQKRDDQAVKLAFKLFDKGAKVSRLANMVRGQDSSVGKHLGLAIYKSQVRTPLAGCFLGMGF